MEQILDDPSVLFARRAVSVILGVALLALAVALALSLATWNVSDPSLTHATSDPVKNLMGSFGAAWSDPVMQLFGLAAPLLIAPLPLWGARLLAGRPLGLTIDRIAAGLAALFLAPGFFAVFPVTEAWPLPLGLGGVVGSVYTLVLSDWLGLTGALAGFVGGLIGLLAIAALLRAVTPVRRRPVSAEAGFQLHRRSAAMDDEYGLDDTDTYEDETSRFAAFRGALAHAALSARARLRSSEPRRRTRKSEAPSLRTALAETGHEIDTGRDVYRAQRRRPAHEETPLAVPEAFEDYADEPYEDETEPRFADAYEDDDGYAYEAADEAYDDEDDLDADYADDRYRDERYADDAYDDPLYADEDDDLPAPVPPRREVARRPVAPPEGEEPLSYNQFRRPLRGPAARLAAKAKAEAKAQEAGWEDLRQEIQEEQLARDLEDWPDEPAPAEPRRIEPVEVDAYDDDYDEDDDDPYAAEAARHAGHGAPRGRAPVRPARPAVPQRPATPPRVAQPAGAMKPGRRQVREAQPSFLSNEDYEFPPLALLAAPPAGGNHTALTEDALEANARVLEGVLEDFGVKGNIIHVRPGPVVTLYELEPAPGIKSSRVIGLADDIARSMSAISARVAVIPGKNAIGIELPNDTRLTVFLRELLASQDFERTKAKLPLCLGKNIGGEAVIADLARMPHLLVAGTTGSGKSVSINTMILSLLYWHKPEQCRVILIDPKMLELSVYDGIPHLLTPVVTEPKKALAALKWAVREMEDRYRKMAKLGVRNIDGYNARLREAGRNGEPLSRIVQTGFDKETGEAIFEEEVLDLTPIPYIVVIVDEMADLMMVAGKEIEGAIQRLAQMARAAGIHVILATQRPSVDVITGTIKANFPTRISFQVTSKIDSRTILGEMGAEQLLGMGDMLYMAGGGRIQRVHGPFVSDEEVEDVVSHLKRQGVPEYLNEVLEDDDEDGDGGAGASGLDALSESDDLYDRAVALVLRDRKASTSYVQRRLSIGYNRAATLIERMENEGVVSSANHAGKREILVPAEEEIA
ncbi:DNA translocase FtsK [Acuticoccus mangrovi]|uniref:DNA translocase FtsK n=1 Tax=Acuticoccus mangrovi TaxID=2796142 RepID=A0A934MHS2_9HYPH|nr:DNA translocase FtsK [Acuticoccus mangrovi]MBJ3777220.1 DNA translocase FtsK [Acuticoccus mangrovi]